MVRLELALLPASDAGRDCLANVSNRLASAARLHRAMSQTSGSEPVDFIVYLQPICEDLANTLNVPIELFGSGVLMPLSDAEEMALVIGELVTNTRKHNPIGLAPVSAKVLVQRLNEETRVFYRDDGVGLPGDFSLAESNGIGMHIIQHSLGKLKASLTPSCGKGAGFRIDLPARSHAPV